MLVIWCRSDSRSFLQLTRYLPSTLHVQCRSSFVCRLSRWRHRDVARLAEAERSLPLREAVAFPSDGTVTKSSDLRSPFECTKSPTHRSYVLPRGPPARIVGVLQLACEECLYHRSCSSPLGCCFRVNRFLVPSIPSPVYPLSGGSREAAIYQS